MDMSLLTKKQMGRPKGAPKGNKVELDNCIEFLSSRGVGVPEVARVLNLSVTLIYRWWKGNITPQKLEMLKELVETIKVWEQEHGQKYGS